MGLLIRTSSAITAERRLHALLAKHKLKTFGNEWFNTSPVEVLDLHEHGAAVFSLGTAIRVERLRQGLNQTQLAKRAGTGQNIVSNLENDHPGACLYTVVGVVAALGKKLTLS